ncbi:hypothetical protein H3L96_02330 [Neisseria wadsworthii]|nr:hypothetical protein H3L96_02330 [Neisseria wadsworthii]
MHMDNIEFQHNPPQAAKRKPATWFDDGDELLRYVFPSTAPSGGYVHQGNLLTNAINKVDGKDVGGITVTDFTFNGKIYKAGEFITDKGDGRVNNFTLNRDGSYVLELATQDYGRSEIVYTVSNGKESVKSTLYMFADQDFVDTGTLFDKGEWVDANTAKVTGNVLENTQNQSENALKIDGFVINGMKYKVGETAAIYGIGTFKMNADGSYELSVEGQRINSHKMPAVSYTVSNGEEAEDSLLYINLDLSKIPPAPYAEANDKANAHVDLNTTKILSGRIDSGNVLDNYEGDDKPYISGFRINNAYYATGQTVKVDNLGEFTMNRDGSFTINASDVADANSRIPSVAYTVTNGYGASSSQIHFQIDKNAPVDADENITSAEKSVTGNVLENAHFTVTEFTVNGTSHKAGETVQIEGVGSFTLNADGAYVLNAATESRVKLPAIEYTVSNGFKTDKSSLQITLQGSTPPDPAQAELIDGDENETFTDIIRGNVLDNASSTLNGEDVGLLSITGFTIDGMRYKAGDTVQFDTGKFTLNANGYYKFDANMSFTNFQAPEIVYTVSNGAKTDTSGLKFSYDWSHLEPNGPPAQQFEFVISAGDNRNGEGVEFNGSMLKSDLMIGDNYKSASATDDKLVAGEGFVRAANDILIGDRINIDHLEWEPFAGGDKIKGSSYDDTLKGLTDYLEAIRPSGNDFAASHQKYQYVRENYLDLLDTNPEGGNDTLIGGHLDDIIIGNAGNDTLTGNAGKDTFVFTINSNSGHDVITDFTKGFDTIKFSDLTDQSQLNWHADTGVLSFTGVQDGQAYENSITIQHASQDLKLEDIIAAAPVMA